jgi:hypothetical protein
MKRKNVIDIFKKKIVIVPINSNNNHWTVAVCDMDKKIIYYYDSLPQNCSECKTSDHKIDSKNPTQNGYITKLISYFGEEYVDKKKEHATINGPHNLCTILNKKMVLIVVYLFCKFARLSVSDNYLNLLNMILTNITIDLKCLRNLSTIHFSLLQK